MGSVITRLLAPAAVIGLFWASPAMAQPLVRLAELEIAPDKVEAYTALLREEIATSIRVEPGVHMLYAVAIKGHPERIRLTEVYADQVAYESHLRSSHFLTYKTATAGMVRALVLHETDPILLGSK